MIMRKMKLAVSFLVIAVAILFAGNNDLYAGGGTTPWPISETPRGSTTWTGTLVITGQIANVPGLPAPGLPSDSRPLVSDQYKDLIVKIEFFVRLENSKKGFGTFSGLGKDNEGYYLFYAIGDYGPGRIGEALMRFLNEKVKGYLPGGPYTDIFLTGLTEDKSNVGDQLQLVGGRENLQPETPLYLNAKITVATY
jgi:hypothetical protein